MTTGLRFFLLGAVALSIVGLAMFSPMLVENVNSGDIVVIQDAIDGDLTVHTQPGIVPQFFGTVTTYHHSNQFWFEEKAEGDTDDGAIRRGCFNMRFNDNGTAEICGSATFDMPTDEASVLAIHQKFKSMDGVVQRLVKTALSKATYNTGRLMSSRESANEKRGDLTSFILGQATDGIYKVEVTTEKVPDLTAEPIVTVEMVDEPVLNPDGTVQLVDSEPVMHRVAKKNTKPAMKDAKVSTPVVAADGTHALEQRSEITTLGIRLYNLTITGVKYDSKVLAQIAAQQKAIMSIQTARAASLKAQQDALTATAQGAAKEATALAAESVKTAQETAQAERTVVVAKQARLVAEQQAAALLVGAEAEAQKKRLLATADGSLTQKLAAWTKAQQFWAAAASKQAQVPQVVIGGSGDSAKGGATSDIQNLTSLALANQLGLDMGIKKTQTK